MGEWGGLVCPPLHPRGGEANIVELRDSGAYDRSHNISGGDMGERKRRVPRIAIWLRGLFGAIRESASVIIAISSMFIAALSLYFSVNAQRVDAEYKEISIQPRPSLLPLFEDMSLSVRNLGLGPAVVKQINFERNGRCLSSYGMNPEEWQTMYSEFLQEIASEVYVKSLPPMPWRKGGKKKFDFEMDILQMNDTVRANEDRYLFRLDSGTFKEFREAETTEQVVAKHKFAANAYAVPIIIVICSATNRTCMRVGEAKACDHLFLREKAKD